MKTLRLCTFFSMLLPMVAFGQYSGPSGGSSSGGGNEVLLFLEGPIGAFVYLEVTSHAKCWQDQGSPSEPCPWTLPY